MPTPPQYRYVSFGSAQNDTVRPNGAEAFLKYLVTCFTVFAFTFSFGQSKYEGDELVAHLGKSVESPEVKGIIGNYHCDIGNPSHCVSNQGLEMVMANSTLREIHLYKGSPAYGAFKGKLPRGLKFGMSPAQVKAILGKPLVSYNNGYSEYEQSDYGISCWFDAGKLSQLNITARQ